MLDSNLFTSHASYSSTYKRTIPLLYAAKPRRAKTGRYYTLRYRAPTQLIKSQL
jgi:hypothetical protein